MPRPGYAALRFVPLGLLLTFITIHGIKVIAWDEDPQRGSAFGMFATVDVGTTRRVEASVPGSPNISLTIPESLLDERTRLADSPSRARAKDLGEALLDLDWTVDGDHADSGGTERFDEVVITVLALEADGLTLTTKTLTNVRVADQR